MNWFYCFVIIQSSVLLLHGRPEHSNPLTFDRRLTLEVGNASPEINVETAPGEAIPSTHLVANVYVEAPSSSGQSHKRLLKLSPHSSNSKKIDLDNASVAQSLGSTESTEKQHTLVSSSSTTVAASSSTTLKPSTTKAIVTSTDIPKTRYNSKLLSDEPYGSELTKHLRISSMSRGSSINSNSDNYHSNSSNDSVAGKHLTDNAIRKLENRQILYPTFILPPMSGAPNPSHDLNQQYVYNLNALVSTTTVIPPNWTLPPPPAPHFVAALRPPVQTQPIQTQPIQTYMVPQQEYFPVPPSSVPQQGMLNVETIFNSLPGGGAAYRPTTQPIQDPLPFPANYASNVTRLHSVVTLSSTTPDPYRNFQKLQTRPIMNKRKVMKIRLSTPKPRVTTALPGFTISISPNDKPKMNANNKNHQSNSNNYGNANNNNRRKNNNNKNKNNNNNNIKNINNNNKNNKNQNNNNTNRKPNKTNNNKNQNKKNNQNQNQENVNQNFVEPAAQATTSASTATNSSLNRLCSVSTAQSNATNDNVCDGGNNLKIIIKFDADSLNTTREALKPSPKPIETANSESEEDDDSDEWEYFYDSPFGLSSIKAPSARRRRRRGQKEKPGGHGDKDQETVNKYQTIILQTPRTPIQATPPVLHKEHDHWKHSLFHKFISFLPFLTLLKPLSFGFWTIVLSPILVIAVSGMALAVVLYPWVSISKEHAAHTAIKRPPTVVIHKHERPNRDHRKYPVTIRYAKPTYSRRESNTDAMNRRPRRPVYDSYNERRPRRHTGRFLRRNKRRADMITSKYTFKDINFQHWLLVKNNFEIRHLTWNDEDDDTDYAR